LCATAGITEEYVVVQPAAYHAAIGHLRPIAIAVYARISDTQMQLAVRVAAEWIFQLKDVHA
jgi:hypothetical protein